MKKIVGFICFIVMCVTFNSCAVSDDCVYTTRTSYYPTATVLYYRPAPKLGYYYPRQYHYHYHKPLPPKRQYNKPHRPTPPSKPHTGQNRRNRH